MPEVDSKNFEGSPDGRATTAVHDRAAVLGMVVLHVPERHLRGTLEVDPVRAFGDERWISRLGGRSGHWSASRRGMRLHAPGRGRALRLSEPGSGPRQP